MNVDLLIDNIVRQTMVLIAQLATASGGRAPLAHIASQVFLNLVSELKGQRLGNKVIADMFGIALRTYHDRVRRLSESATDRGTSLFEAVLRYVRQRDVVTQAQVLTRFHRDNEAVVRALLSDLTGSGLLYRSGRGAYTTYRATSMQELGQTETNDKSTALEYMIWVTIHRLGSCTLVDLAQEVGLEKETVEGALSRLVADGRVVAEMDERDGKDGVSAQHYRSDECVISYEDTSGWEAALFDHYQAVVSAIGAKVVRGANYASANETIGGSTYHFDLYPGHVLEKEVQGLLASVRQKASTLRLALEESKDANAPVEGQGYRVIFYVGQNLIGYTDTIDKGEHS